MRDLYLWMANVPNGPSAKFLVENSKYIMAFFFKLIISVSRLNYRYIILLYDI